jgi:HEAT repeat protein
MEALKDKNGDIRKQATVALGGIACYQIAHRQPVDRRVVEPLIEALKDKDSNVREEAAGALGCLCDQRAMTPLIEILKDKDEDSNVRAAAAGALGYLGQTSGDEKAREACIDAAKASKDKQLKYGDMREEAMAWLRWGETRGNDRAIEALISALKDKDSDVRLGACVALGIIGNPKAVEPLIEALKDENGNVCSLAAVALGEIRDERAVEPLIDALSRRDSRVEAAQALGRIGSYVPKAWAASEQAYRDRLRSY